MQCDPSWRTDAAKLAAGSSMEAEPECPRVFWLGTTCTEGPISRPPGPVAALGVFPTLPGPDIVEPVAVATTAPAAFAEATGLAAFDAETEDCFALFVEIKGEESLTIIRPVRDTRGHSHRRWTRCSSRRQRRVHDVHGWRHSGMHTQHTASASLTESISDAYARHTPTPAFDHGILFLLDEQHRAHLFNRGRVHHRRDRRRRACVHEWGVCMCRGADKRVVSRRQVRHVESDTTNCHSSPFRQRIRVGPRERRWKRCDISY